MGLLDESMQAKFWEGDGDEGAQYSAPVNDPQAQNKPSIAAEDKRKMQRRAAQKAYRERQEQRSVHLTQKIGHLEEKNRALSTNNEQLELEIVRFSAESDALLATIHSGNRSTTDGPVSATELTPATLLEAPRLNPALNSIASDVWNHPVHRITESKTGEKLLDIAAAWDMIQGHESFKAGLVDIDVVRQRLEGFAQCTGQGIAFEESRILSAIEESIISE